MVRCDMIDAMDRTLRKLMHSAMPFGGKQMIFSGDIFQLEPITGLNAQKELLRDFYGTDEEFVALCHPLLDGNEYKQKCSFLDEQAFTK